MTSIQVLPDQNPLDGAVRETSMKTSPNKNEKFKEAGIDTLQGDSNVLEPINSELVLPHEPMSMSRLQIALIMTALCFSVFLAALDVTIVTTSLSTISEYFQSSAPYTWVGSAFMLANAASTPIWGKLSDIWGRRPLLLAATATFFFGSTLCGASINITMLICGRAVQGIGAGGLLTLVNIVISDLFSMRDRSTYYAIIGITWAFASAIGPLLGGVLTSKASWRWCFYINLPITGIAFLIILFRLNLETPKVPAIAGLKAIDWVGSLILIGSTAMFLLGLEFGGVLHPWSSAIVLCLLILGLLAFVLFYLYEWKIPMYPIMPLRIFSNISNLVSLLGCFLHGMVFVAASYFLPLYFQSVLGATVLQSGFWILPFVLSLSLSASITGWYIGNSGKYIPPILFGSIMTVLGFGVLIDLPETRYWPKIIIYQILCGVGVGTNFQSLLLALQNNVAPKDMATATATFAFTRALAISISIVVGTVIFQNGMQSQTSLLQQTLGSIEADLFSGSNAGANIFLVNNLPQAQKTVVQQAFLKAIKGIWICIVCFAALGLVFSFGVKAKELSREPSGVTTGLEMKENVEENPCKEVV